MYAYTSKLRNRDGKSSSFIAPKIDRGEGPVRVFWRSANCVARSAGFPLQPAVGPLLALRCS